MVGVAVGERSPADRIGPPIDAMPPGQTATVSRSMAVPLGAGNLPRGGWAAESVVAGPARPGWTGGGWSAHGHPRSGADPVRCRSPLVDTGEGGTAGR